MTITQYPQFYNNAQILTDQVHQLESQVDSKAVICKKLQYQPTWFEWTKSFLPSTHDTGTFVGTRIGTTYGGTVSNYTIKQCVRFLFGPEKQNISLSTKIWNTVKGGAQVATTSTAQMAITPYVLPCITVLSGAAGGFALVGTAKLIGKIYEKATFNSRELKTIENLPLDQLFYEDADFEGRYRDVFGRLLSAEDTRSIFSHAAQHNLIARLMETGKKINEIMDMSVEDFVNEYSPDLYQSILTSQIDGNMYATCTKEKQVKAEIKGVIQDYFIQTYDENGSKVWTFLDGTVCSQQDKQIIKAGIETLRGVNPMSNKQNIQLMLELVAKRSLLPETVLNLENFNNQDGVAKRMNFYFQDEENAWKNAIIQTAAGQFIVVRSVENKTTGQLVEKGTIISEDTMLTILTEVDTIEKQKAFEQKKQFITMLKNPKEHSDLTYLLSRSKNSDVNKFLRSQVYTHNDVHFYGNGKVMEQSAFEKFAKDVAFLPSRDTMVERQKRIYALVKDLSANQTHELDAIYESHMVCCPDGVTFLDRETLEVLDDKEIQMRLNNFQKIEEDQLGEGFVVLKDTVV